MIEAGYASSNSGAVMQTIKLFRPPVVLMHGVWSDGGAWEGLERYLKSRGFNICDGCRPDYGTVEEGRYKAGSFDPTNAVTREQRFVIEQLIGATRWALDSYRAPQITSPPSPKGYAITQVDIVGHSMGGLVARARASRSYEAVPYERVENYNRGEFHKIITVGSPHRGSPLADILVARRCHRFILGRRIWTVEELLAGRNYPIGPAIFGFQTASKTLRNVGATNIPSHAIVGIAPDDSDTEDVLNWILKVFGDNRVDTLLLGNGNHDTIVPRYSQLGGLNESAASPRTGVVHANLEMIERGIGVTRPDDTGETASENIWQRIAELLRADVSGEDFGNFTAFTSTREPIEQTPCPVSSLSEVATVATSATVSLSPAPGTVVRPGAIIELNFRVDGGNQVAGAFFANGEGFLIKNGGGPFSFSFAVPTRRAGRMDIHAATFGPGPENYDASTFVIIQPEVPPLRLSVAPHALRFERAGESFQLRTDGWFANDVSLDLTSRHAGTSYRTQSERDTVVSVTPDGLVEARGAGQDIIVVTNSGKTVAVNVSVNLSNPAPGIISLTPTLVAAGGNDFTLTVSGRDFISGSVIYWNGGPRPTTFVSPTQLRAVIAASDIATAGKARVSVYNPTPGGGVATTDLTISASPAVAVTSVSAASFGGAELATESIVAAFGTNLATSVQVASSIPLPTSLAGTTVNLKDSAGVERMVPLFFVAPSQVNYQIPPGTASGAATITITSGNGAISLGAIQIAAVAPGLFSANASGQGIATGVALRVKADGSQIYEPISRFDQVQNKIVAIPLELGPATDQLFLILYGTGIRFRSSLSAVTARVGGADAEALYAGPADGFVGLDQVNLRVPRSLIGRGEADIVITADGKTANAVRVSIGPVTASMPTLTSINPNSAVAGSSAFTLTVNGTNFVNGSVVRWNGNDRATTFISGTQLRAAIPASDIVSAGMSSVSVFNPGGGVSNSLPFSITQACAYSISPASQSFSALGGSGSVNITATSGCNWTASSNASWVTINSGGGGSGNGTVTFSVAANPNPAERTGMLTIAFQTFTVTQVGGSNPAPAITSLAPNSIAAGGPAFSLTVNGTGFVVGSVVRWNGSNRVTTYVSNTQLNAQIPASDIASAGTASITVFNPSPGGGISNASSIVINSSLRWRESGLNGEVVNSFVVRGTSIFASTRDRDFGAVLSGIHRSTDNGQNWIRVFSGLSNQNVNALTVKGTTLYAGTSGPGTSGSVYRSTDNGQNWTQINSGLPNQYVASIATGGTAVFAGMGRLLPGESGGVYKLSDSGQSWTRVFQAPPNQGVTTLAANGMNIFAGTNGIGTSGNVYRTTDGGQNWTLVFSGQRNQSVNSMVVIGNLVLAGTSDFNTLNIVYRSTDNGQNWTQIASGLTNRDVRAFAALGTSIFAGSPGGGVYRSTDNGQNWTAINDGLTNLGVISLGVSGTRLLAGLNGGGVFSLDIGYLVTPLPVSTQQITGGQTISGALTLDDQVQLTLSGRTYFFDAYHFTTTQANTTVGLDMRSSQFDATVLLYQVNDNRLSLIAVDDQTGGYGNGKIENNNALLLTVLPTPGDYVIFASSSDYEPFATGNYTLKLLTNAFQPIKYGDNLNGANITTSDIQTSAGVYLDAYWFNGMAGDNVRIRMGSAAFDSFLILQRNSGGSPIASDDNSGGGPQGQDAQINFQLPASGNYILVATPYEPGKTGIYSLTLDKQIARLMVEWIR